MVVLRGEAFSYERVGCSLETRTIRILNGVLLDL